MSQLTRVIALLYRMESADVKELAAELLDARKRAWDTALREQAALHGCTGRRPAPPRKDDLAELKRQSNDEAQGIAATYNRDVEREIERLYDANPRGNRQYYMTNLERWAGERAAWKNVQIAINVEQSTRYYAQQQFASKNNLTRRYKFVGASPVCRECMRLFGMGIVTQRIVDLYPCPRHVGCPHEWEVVNPKLINCADMWLG